MEENKIYRRIDTELLNIVEADGTRKLCLFNSQNVPPALMDGVDILPGHRQGTGLAGIMFFWFCKKQYVEEQVNKGRNKPMFGWFYPLCKYVFCPICFLVLLLGALNGGIG